jgi:arginine repressor
MIAAIFAVAQMGERLVVRASESANAIAQKTAGPKFDLVTAIKAVRINVVQVQVQRWLTDISAPRVTCSAMSPRL